LAADHTKSPPPTLIAERYELGRLIGEGGMGLVYEARMHGPHGFMRKVAFKRLKPEAVAGSSSWRDFQRFLDEARIASHLHHGGIVGVLDYGIISDTDGPFQVMELIDGIDVETLIATSGRGVGLPPDIALYIALEVAHALAYVHTAAGEDGAPLKITHRDVKPSNIFISKSGDVKLGDFGIASAMDRISKKTTTGIGKGTPAFMAPEQALGKSELDGRADVFALGCTLHAMLTTSTPIPTNVPLALYSPEPLSTDKTLAPPITELIRRAISKNPAERFDTAAAMAAALSSLATVYLKTDGRSRLASWMKAFDAATVDRPPTEDRATTTIPDAQPAQRPPRPPTTTASRKPKAPRSELGRFVLIAIVTIVLGSALVAAGFLIAHRQRDRVEPSEATVTAEDAGAVASSLPPPPAIESSTRPPEIPPVSSAAAARGRVARGPAGGGRLCQCIPASGFRDRIALCHPSKRHAPVCSCSGVSLYSRSFVECDEPTTPCVKSKTFPSTAKSGDACEAYTIVGTKTVKLEKDTLNCTVCEADRDFPHNPGAECHGFHSTTGEPVEGRIICDP